MLKELCGPPNSIPEQTWEGPRGKNYLTRVFALQRQSCTEHVLCDLNRHFSYRGSFTMFIREARDSLVYLDIRLWLWSHAQAGWGWGGERDRVYFSLVLHTFISLCSLLPSLLSVITSLSFNERKNKLKGNQRRKQMKWESQHLVPVLDTTCLGLGWAWPYLWMLSVSKEGATFSITSRMTHQPLPHPYTTRLHLHLNDKWVKNTGFQRPPAMHSHVTPYKTRSILWPILASISTFIKLEVKMYKFSGP